MQNSIFDHITIVNWAPGFLGTFLLNFLSDKVNTDKSLSQAMYENVNKEWEFSDIFNNFAANNSVLNDKTFAPIVNQFKHLGRLEVFKIILMTVANSRYFLIKNGMVGEQYQLLRKHYNLVSHIINDPLNPEYQIPIDFLTEHSSLFIKTHPNCLVLQEQNWKKKITCVFPLEYTWIPHVMLYGKYYFYHVEEPDRVAMARHRVNMSNKELMLVENWHALDQAQQLCNDFHVSAYYKSSYKFDMYNLIFLQNLDQVYEIEPNFKFTDGKKQMLERVKLSSEEILDKVNLTSNYQVDVSAAPRDFIKQFNLGHSPTK